MEEVSGRLEILAEDSWVQGRLRAGGMSGDLLGALGLHGNILGVGVASMRRCRSFFSDQKK